MSAATVAAIAKAAVAVLSKREDPQGIGVGHCCNTLSADRAGGF